MKAKNTLKKLAGSQLANFICRNFNQTFAINKIKEHFNNDGKDVKMVKESDYVTFKNWLNSLSIPEDVENVETRTATEIFKDLGYELIRTKKSSDADKFKPLFKSDELLCKFDSASRFSNSDVFFIVKENADKIKRSDDPSRQDEYSTSVMSMAVSSDGRNLLQITSRYNHTVSGCDNTYGSNLDNISDGLTEAFNKEFNYNIKATANQFELDSFVQYDGKYVYYHTEINGTKIGNNTIVSDKIFNYSFDHFYTYSYYIIDLRTCKIVWDEMNTSDSFVDYFNDTVKRIEFVKDIDAVDDNGSDEVCYIQKKS